MAKDKCCHICRLVKQIPSSGRMRIKAYGGPVNEFDIETDHTICTECLEDLGRYLGNMSLVWALDRNPKYEMIRTKG